MLTPHGFYEDQLPRITSAIHRLAALIWHPQPEPLEVHDTQPTPEMLTFEQGTARKSNRVDRLPEHWGMMFDQRWCRVALPRPASANDWIEWRGQGETTLYHEGIPFGGTDLSRKHVRLPEGITEFWAECVAENIGIWTPAGEDIDPHGCRFEGVFLARRDDAAWRAHTDLAILHELIQIERRAVIGPDDTHKVPWGPRDQLNRATPRLKFLVEHLSLAVDAFEADGPAAMLRNLDAILEKLRGGDPLFEAILTGHAHIDLVWRWPRRVGEFKAVHTFANALGLLDLYPGFVFGYSQPASYEAVESRSPELMQRVRTKLSEGRWEAAGMTYVESDTQLACGEALARSFLIGQQSFTELTGKPSPVLWLPDAFGFSQVLPQLILESGGIGFFSTKVHWSSTNRFPHSAFRWRGANGSEVLGFVPGTFDYNGEATAHRVHDGALQQRQSAVFPHTLLPTGIGDGGGGPTEEMCRRAEVLADLAGMPRTRWGRIDDFYSKLEQAREKLPVWKGEIYLEYHRGVQTTGHELKSVFRATERAMQAWEAAAVLTQSGPVDPQAWKRLVFAQFHDDIPGSSCGEVYAEHIPELKALEHSACQHAITLLGEDTEASIFNPLPLTVRTLIDGQLHELAPLSVTPKNTARIESSPSSATTTTLSSDRVHAELSPEGLLTALSIDGKALRLSAPMGGVVAFADRPHAFEAWDIDRASLDHPLPAQRQATIRVEKADGPEVIVAVEFTVARTSSVITRYRLIAGEPVVRIEYEIDLREPDTLLKAVFPTEYAGAMARFGSPFGSVLRGQRQGPRSDEAQFESPASRWCWVCDDGEQEGLALMAESKYGYGAQAGLLHLSLVRSALVTPWGLQTALRRDDAGPSHFDMGRSLVRTAVGLAGTNLPRDQQPAALAETLFVQPIACQANQRISPLLGLSGSEHIIPVWVKPADRDAQSGAFILRLHEVVGRPGTIHLELAQGWVAQRVDLRENPLGDVHADASFQVAPGAFASVRIARA